MSSTYSINLNTVTMPAYSAISKADRKFIGTDDYMGLAWYHAHHYRFIMRDEPTVYQRKRIHNKWLEAKLPLGGFGPHHNKILAEVLAGTICPMSDTPWAAEEILQYGQADWRKGAEGYHP
jgi:hypothetical protein